MAILAARLHNSALTLRTPLFSMFRWSDMPRYRAVLRRAFRHVGRCTHILSLVFAGNPRAAISSSASLVLSRFLFSGSQRTSHSLEQSSRATALARLRISARCTHVGFLWLRPSGSLPPPRPATPPFIRPGAVSFKTSCSAYELCSAPTERPGHEPPTGAARAHRLWSPYRRGRAGASRQTAPPAHDVMPHVVAPPRCVHIFLLCCTVLIDISPRCSPPD